MVRDSTTSGLWHDQEMHLGSGDTDGYHTGFPRRLLLARARHRVRRGLPPSRAVGRRAVRPLAQHCGAAARS